MSRWWRVAVVAAGCWLPVMVLAAPPEPASDEESVDERSGDAARVDPRTAAKAAFDEGLAHERRHKYQQAIEAYQRSLKIIRRQPEVLSHLAACHRVVQDYRKVITYAKEALRFQSDLADVRLWLGEAYLKTGQMELAQTQYEKLKSLDEDKAKELKRLIDAAGEAKAAAEPAASLETHTERMGRRAFIQQPQR
jgi:tetratricopeptide (TPR) repeat protein